MTTTAKDDEWVPRLGQACEFFFSLHFFIVLIMIYNYID